MAGTKPSDAAGSRPCFPFLVQKEVEWLGQHFVNCVQLGQWELARATVQVLAESGDEGAALAKTALAATVWNPAATGVVGSREVPTLHHLAWLCAVEHDAAFPEQPVFPELALHAEFQVTLRNYLGRDVAEQINELASYHQRLVTHKPGDTLLTLSPSAIELILDTTRKNPILGQAIGSYLIESSGADTALRSQLLGDQVKLIGQLLSQNQEAEAFAAVVRLQVAEADAEAEWLGELVTLLNNYNLEAGLQTEEGWHRYSRMVSSLLAHGPPFVALQALRDLEASSVGPERNAANVDTADHPRFWGTAFLQSHNAAAREPHALSQLIGKTVQLATDRDFEGLKKLASSKPLAPLGGLVLLLAWGKCEDAKSAAQLLGVLSTLPQDEGADESPDLFAIVQRKLEFNLELAQFCEDIAGAEGSELLPSLTTDMMANPGIPYALPVLHRLSALATAEDVGILGILARQPSFDGVDTVEIDRDIIVVKSFCAVKHVLAALKLARDEAVTSTAGPTPSPFSPEAIENGGPEWVGQVHQLLERAAALIQSLEPLQYRVEVIECVFALLFLRAPANNEFVAVGLTVEAVLTLLRECLAEVQDETTTKFGPSRDADVDQLESHRCELAARPLAMSISRVALQARVARMEQYVSEASWRHNLVCGSQVGDKRRQSDIVNRMLASPTTLLTTCLLARDFSRAQEVIEMFNIDNDVSRDARFSQQLSDTATALSEGGDAAKLIDNLAAENLETTAFIHICVDLALTAASNQASCDQLLSRAAALIEANNDATVGRTVTPLIHKLRNSMSVVQTSLRDLITSHERPVDTESIKAAERDAEDRRIAYNEVMAAVALAEPLAATRTARSASVTERAHRVASLKSLQTTAIAAMHTAREAFTPHGIGGGDGASADKTQYLNALLSQLETLEQASSSGNVDASAETSSVNPLRHLNESPIQIVSRLIFDGMDLVSAREAAAKLHLDLTHVIVRSTCSPLEIKEPGHFPARVATTDPGAMSADTAGHALNMGVNSWDTPLTANACTITHDILQGICTILMQFQGAAQFVPLNGTVIRSVRQLKDFQRIEQSLSQLDAIDYRLLTDAERLCVYSNLVNIMRLHGSIIFGPVQSAVQWVHWSKSIKYSLGALGVVSLFDLEFSYLRGALPTPQLFDGALRYLVDDIGENDSRRKFVVTVKEPSLQFGIWSGHASSPSPTPLLPSSYQGVLQNAKTLYFVQHVQVKRGGVVLMPRLVQWYLADFLDRDARDAASIRSFVAANLPAGSVTHAYVTNATNTNIEYGKFSFAPLCRMTEPGLIDPRHSTPYSIPSSVLDDLLCNQQDSVQPHKFPVTQKIKSFLQENSEVVKVLVSLANTSLHPEIRAGRTGSVGETTDHGADSKTRDFFDIILEQMDDTSDACTPLVNLVRGRLGKIVGLPQCRELSPQIVTAFLLNCNLKIRHRASCTVLDDLMLSAQYKACIDLIDTGLFQHYSTPKDFLLCAAIAKAAGDSASWRSVARLHDKDLAARIVLERIGDWDVDVAVDMLTMCKLHFDQKQAPEGKSEVGPLAASVAEQLSRLEVYAEVLQYLPSLNTWQEVMRISLEDPDKIVRGLIDAQRFDLGRRWCTLHSVAESEIEQNFLLNLLDDDETLRAHQVLTSMHPAAATRVCEFIVRNCRQLRGVVFVVRYMVQSLVAELTPERVSELNAMELGASILMLLEPNLQYKLRSLVGKPQRLLEHLLMNKQVGSVKLALSQMDSDDADNLTAETTFCLSRSEEEMRSPETPPSLQVPQNGSPFGSPFAGRRGAANNAPPSPYNGRSPMKRVSVPAAVPHSPGPARRLVDRVAGFRQDIISYYAEKAVSPKPDSAAQATEWTALLADEDHYELRKNFYYTQAPSTALCMAIVDLYRNPHRCGDTCLYLCSKLSDRLAADPTAHDHYFMINSIRRLLYNAKLKYLDCGATSKIELCDAYLSHAELLRLLLASRCEYLLSITDLIDSDKARRLRDRLIEDDKMDLAVQVSTKCNLDSFDVWASWGRAKLEIGLFEEARAKFERCLQRGGSNDSRQQRLLEAIVEMLQSPPCPTLEDIQHMQSELRLVVQKAATADQKSCATSHHYRQAALFGTPLPIVEGSRPPPQPPRVAFIPRLVSVAAVNHGRVSTESCMNSERYHEANWYLETFGPDEMVCRFRVDNGFSLSACRYVIDKNVAPKVFVEGIFKPHQASDSIPELLEILNQLDSTLTKWSPHLIATCRYLTKAKMIHTLYGLQVFMKDFYRAGITSVKFASETDLTVQDRVDYLLKARGHFSVCESEQPASAEELRTHGEVQERLRAVELQLDVVRFFSERASAAQADGDTGRAAHLKSTCRLSLFGSDVDRRQICSELMDNIDDFDERTSLVIEIVTFYKLSLVLVLQMVAPRIAAKGNPQIVDDFLRFISERVTSEEWDDVLRALVDTLFKLDEGKAADKLVQRMKNDKAKIDAHIACKKLKGAYLVAVRTKNITEIRRIHQLALETGNKGVVNICEMFFKSQNS